MLCIIKSIGRGLVDRYRGRLGGWIRFIAVVQCQGFQFHCISLLGDDSLS